MEKEKIQMLIEDINRNLHFLDYALGKCIADLTRAQEAIDEARRIIDRE